MPDRFPDWPPVWLIGAVALAWVLGRLDPWGLSFGGQWADFIAGLLVGSGIILMGLAVAALRRHRTTVIPHREAEALVTTGIFRRSRNPIYLGDALVLAGLILWFDAPLALPLIPLFIWIIERRFIEGEEARLKSRFGPAFETYVTQTRRWL